MRLSLKTNQAGRDSRTAEFLIHVFFISTLRPPAGQKTCTSVKCCLKFSEIPVLQDQLPVSLLLSLSAAGCTSLTASSFSSRSIWSIRTDSGKKTICKRQRTSLAWQEMQPEKDQSAQMDSPAKVFQSAQVRRTYRFMAGFACLTTLSRSTYELWHSF